MPTTYAIPNGRTVMDATTYTGSGSQTASFTNTAGFKPDMVWSRIRTGTTQGIGVFDSVRGVTGQCLDTASNTAEGTWNGAASSDYGYVSAFNSNGFSVNDGAVATTGGYVNYSGRTYVAWQWQAGQGTTSSNTSGSVTSTVSVNQTAGFSITTYTTPSSAGVYTVGHGLGATPQLVINKRRDGAGGWVVWHISLNGTGNTNQYLILNSTDAKATSGSTIWSAPTSTTFGLNSGTSVDQSATYVTYCWAPVAGFSAFGSYTGNGSADGPFVYLGFRPKYILIKATSRVENWHIHDTSRNPYNLADCDLYTESTNEETTLYNQMDILSNGFKLRATNSGTNNNGDTYAYICFAENPFKYANAR